VYTYAVGTRDEEDEGLRTVTVLLTDEAGNAPPEPETLGTRVMFDFTPPGLAGTPVVAPLVVKKGSLVTLSFDADEPLGPDPVVSIGGGTMKKAEGAGTSFKYTYSVNGGETEDEKQIGITLTDRAGNVSDPITLGSTVRFDFTGPQILNPSVTPRGMKDTIISVTFSSDEKLGADPDVKAGAMKFDKDPASGGNDYVYTYKLLGTEEEGVQTVTIANLSDEAGNTATTQTAGTFVTDFKAPSVMPGAAVNPAFARNGVEVTVTFDASEELSMDPAVYSGPSSFAKKSKSGNRYVYARTLDQTEVEGALTISADLADLAGNVTSGVAVAVFLADFSPPGLKGTPVVLPPVAGPMMQVTATFETDEALGAEPVAKIGAIPMDAGPKSGSQYTFTHIAAQVDGEGDKPLSVHLQDLSGNTSDVAPGQKATFDFTAPAATLVSVDPGPFRSPKSVPAEPDIIAHVKFTTAEALDPDPAVGQVKVLIGDSAKATCPSGANTTFDCTYTVPKDLGSGNALEGPRSVSVELTDGAGNKGSTALGTITFDFTKPTVVSGSESLQLIPATGNPLPTVKSVAYGTAARISFTASEILLGDPVVALSPATGDWTVTKKNAAGSFYVYDAVLTGGWPDQTRYDVVVTLADLAGNVSDPVTLALPSAPNPSLTVDTVVPAVPDVETLDRIIYTRIPWGSDATQGVKTFALRGEANGVEPNAAVIVYDAADVATAAEIGRVTADATGAFGGDIGSGREFLLNRADRVSVYVATVDSAGNQSDADPGKAGIQATEVKDAEWIATMGGKIAGSTLENPHRFAKKPWFANSLFQGGVVEAGAADGIDRLGGGIADTAGSGTWRLLVSQAPSERQNFGMTYDSARGHVLLFGGMAGDRSVLFQDTWKWDGAKWTLVIPEDPEGDANPSPRSGQAMVYDSRRGVAVLFGGGGPDDDMVYGDTWEWNGKSWKMRYPEDVEGDGNPSARRFHAMTYDSRRGVTVLFGGWNASGNCAGSGSNYCGDTWEYDGRSWKQVAVSGTTPSARRGHAMTYATKYSSGQAWQRSILFGGYGVDGSKGDVWEWDGSAWLNTSAGGTGCPTARENPAIAYDCGRKLVVLFGGGSSSGSNQTWEWDGTQWTDKSATSTALIRKRMHKLEYDAVAGKIVLFGGGRSTYAYQDTWEYDGTAWEMKTYPAADPAVVVPQPRTDHVMVYDQSEDTIMLFGGYADAEVTSDCDGSGTLYCGGTYIFKAHYWTKSSAAGPSARRRAAAAYHETDTRVFFFGGEAGSPIRDFWLWDGSAWAAQTCDTGFFTPISLCPSARSSQGMAYSKEGTRVMMFGGNTSSTTQLNETHSPNWEEIYDPGFPFPLGWFWNWYSLSSSNPIARAAPAMAYVDAASKLVMFGGYNSTDCGEGGGRYCGYTWYWNGTGWTTLTQTGPKAREEHAMAYDASRGSVVLFGGVTGKDFTESCNENGMNFCGGTWELRDSNWSQVTPADPEGDGNPSPRFSHAMTHDSKRKRTVLFGGVDYSGSQNDTWEWRGGADAAAGQTASFDFSRSELSDGAQMKNVSVSWHAGGVGYQGGTETPGVVLKVWDEGMWKDVDSKTVSPTGMGDVSWTTSDALQMSRLLFGDSRTLNFSVVPGTPNGTGDSANDYGRVVTDYVEFKAGYRSP